MCNLDISQSYCYGDDTLVSGQIKDKRGTHTHYRFPVESVIHVTEHFMVPTLAFFALKVTVR